MLQYYNRIITWMDGGDVPGFVRNFSPSLDLKKILSVGQKLKEQRCDLFELLVRNESLLKYRDVTPPKSRQEMDVC